MLDKQTNKKMNARQRIQLRSELLPVFSLGDVEEARRAALEVVAVGGVARAVVEFGQIKLVLRELNACIAFNRQ